MIKIIQFIVCRNLSLHSLMKQLIIYLSGHLFFSIQIIDTEVDLVS